MAESVRRPRVRGNGGMLVISVLSMEPTSQRHSMSSGPKNAACSIWWGEGTWTKCYSAGSCETS